ncbi:multidrug and toxin extrusion protein 1-like [Oscarella lobularis]|uniref:multidrug and toxin extrusion protein 1-like n=1 Tax=Oscarella lobularis TaxID=121494 RepID=UPI0033133A16
MVKEAYDVLQSTEETSRSRIRKENEENDEMVLATSKSSSREEDKGFFCWKSSFLTRRFLSPPVRAESRILMSLAWPVTVTYLFQFLLPMSAILICGHIGETELDSVGLAVSITNVTGLSVAIGMASACDTLFSQAVGAKNKKEVSIVLQKGILILGLTCLPIFGVWLNIEPLLLGFRVSCDVARQAGTFSKILIAGLPGNLLYALLQKFIQNQGIVKPPLIVGLLSLSFAVIANSIAVFVFHNGIETAAAIVSVAYTLQPIILLMIMKKWNLGLDMWHGWSWECIYEWKTYILLAIPGILMLCIEWWSYELGILVTSMVNKVESGAFIVSFNVTAIAFMIPLGVSVAASIRVGNLLGANKPWEAKRSAWTAFGIATFFALIISMVLLSARHVLGWIYSDSQDIVDLAAKLFIILAASEIFDYTQATLGGVYRGAGRQKIASVFNFIGYYVIGLPIGIPLALVVGMGGIGMWIGLLLGVTTQAIFATVFVARFDWVLEAKKARERVGVSEEEDLCENELKSSIEMKEAVSDDLQLLTQEDVADSEEKIDAGDAEVGYLTGRSQQRRSSREFRRVLLQRIAWLITCLAILAACAVVSEFKWIACDDKCLSQNGSVAINGTTLCPNNTDTLPTSLLTPRVNISGLI